MCAPFLCHNLAHGWLLHHAHSVQEVWLCPRMKHAVLQLTSTVWRRRVLQRCRVSWLASSSALLFASAHTWRMQNACEKLHKAWDKAGRKARPLKETPAILKVMKQLQKDHPHQLSQIKL